MYSGELVREMGVNGGGNVELGASDFLLSRAKGGDRAAIEALIVRHERQVYGTAWRLLGHRQDAEDASQEVFLRLLRYLHRFDETRAMGPWLYRITVNVCRSLARKRRRHATTALEDAPPETMASEEQGRRAVTLDEERRLLMLGLQSLSKREREALVLRDIEGLTTREVAAALGSSETTVRSQVCRARLKMKAFRERIRRNEP